MRMMKNNVNVQVGTQTAKSKKRIEIKVSHVIILIALLAYTISLLTPLLWMLLTSFKNTENWDMAMYKKDLIGVIWIDSFRFENYVEAYNLIYIMRTVDGENYGSDLLIMFGNSLMYAGGCAVVATITPCVVAYLCARYEYRFGKVVYTIVLVTIAIPIIGNLPAEKRMIDNFNLMDSLWALLILKANFLGIYFLIFYAQFKGIARDYTSAAEIDGASEFRIMVQIIFPLAISSITSVFLLNFIAFWNDYQIPMVYWYNSPVVAFGLFEFSIDSDAAKTPIQLAGALLTALPIIAVFAVFNKKVMSNMSTGGIKG